MAAMLHDTVEDTDTTLEEIAREFGAEVANIVEVRPSLLLWDHQRKLTSPLHFCLSGMYRSARHIVSDAQTAPD